MKYIDIHFRLESGYKWGSGLDEDKSNAFHVEIYNLFSEAGWKISGKKYDNSCYEAWMGKSRLYLHPMDASGEVAVDLIPKVENILSKGTTFKHYRTDNYRELFDMTDDEYIKYLNDNRENIKHDLINGFRTKRSNLYVTYTLNVIEKVKEKYHIDRLKNHIGRSSNDIEWRYTEDMFKELVDNNVFITADTKHGLGYRTKTDKELKTEKKTT